MTTTPAQTAQPAPPVTEATVASSTVPGGQAVTDIIDLPRGTELKELAAKVLATARPVRLIVFAGPVDAGKTTLLTSLYELFQWNDVPDYQFAGSSTLPAFELRCHLGRIGSEQPHPDTQRNAYKGPEPEYLHLRVARANATRATLDFLFTDVSGEMFEHASNSTDRCKELTFLRRATDFLLLLDGEKCSRPDERHATIQMAKTILQSCLDSEMLADYCVVNVVWTKVDWFEASADRKKHEEFCKQVEDDFRNHFGPRIPHLTFSKIAARPTKSPELGFGNGVPALLNGWMANRPQSSKINFFPELPLGTRESELYAQRAFKSGMDHE